MITIVWFSVQLPEVCSVDKSLLAFCFLNNYFSSIYPAVTSGLSLFTDFCCHEVAEKSQLKQPM